MYLTIFEYFCVRGAGYLDVASCTCIFSSQGITNTENRKEWPVSVLRKVLDELMTETPKDLLAKYELVLCDNFYLICCP